MNIKWKKASEELPDSSRRVLGTHIFEGIEGRELIGINSYLYSAKHKAFNASDEQEFPENAVEVDYWAELPTLAEVEQG